MAQLSSRNVFLLVIKLVIINEIVCFPLNFFENNIFSESLGYVSKQFNSIQPRFNLQKILKPETYTQKMYTQPNTGRYNVLQKLPPIANNTKTNSLELRSNLSTESSNSNNNNATQKPKLENEEIDEKWNSFFDEYFNNKLSKSENSLITIDKINNEDTVNMILTTDNINNEETPQTLKDILDDNNIETTNESFTDTTDTTPFDNETTTGDDDLLRNGVPPELLSSLLG